MRIVISNPDSLGDVMLREPLFAAVHEAGHELLLVVRDFVAPLAKDIAPYAELAVCAGNPYSSNFSLDSPLGREMKKKIERFSAELFVAASYQYTELEQQLAACLPGIDIIGLSGHLSQPIPNVIAPSTVQFSSRVQVSIDTPESTKNELLCGAILGSRVSLPAPKLTPTSAGRKLAANHLRKLGLKNTAYWTVCAGDRPPLGLKNWEPEKWIELCRTLIEKHNIRILFIGTPEEHDSTKAIQESLGLAARHTASITGEPMTIGELVGLLDGAQGYIGKDTGPMHLAAALGKPVVAVFGGGHWPRFVPLARTGAVFSVDVPCKGCNWVCQLQRSHCVKDIPISTVLHAVEKVIEGQEAPFYVDLLPREGLLEAEMFREMYEKAQSAYQVLDTERADFAQWHGDRMRDMEGLTSGIEGTRREAAAEAEAAAVEIASRDAGIHKLEGVCLELRDEIGRLQSGLDGVRKESTAEVASRNLAIAEANQRSQRQETEIAILTGTSRDLREERGDLTRQLAESRFQIDKLESRVAALDTGSVKLIEEHEQMNARIERLEQTEISLRAQVAEEEAGKAGAQQALQSLELELSGKLLMITRLQAHHDTIEIRHLGRAADLEKSLAVQKRDNQLALAVIPELRDELASTQRELDDWRAAFRDFSYRLGNSGDNPKSLLADAASRLQAAEGQVSEFTMQLRTAAGEQGADIDWRSGLAFIESDRERRLAIIHELSGHLDRAERMGLNEFLYRHIAGLAAERKTILGRIRYRIMRALRIL